MPQHEELQNVFCDVQLLEKQHACIEKKFAHIHSSVSFVRSTDEGLRYVIAMKLNGE